MSLHSTLHAAAGLGQLFRAQGESIAYIDAAGSSTPLTALVGDKRAVRKDGKATGSVYEHERTFTITRDAASPFGGVANPQKNATITFGTESYAITGIESQSTTETTVTAGFCGQANLEARTTRGKP